jgi:ATP-dependent DNA helicase RecQ
MKKFTANYAWTNPNFVIQNLVEGARPEYYPLLCVIKNILQRGFPTTMSKFLQEKLGAIHDRTDFKDRMLFASCKVPQWNDTIKGDKANNNYPARDFFERIIPEYFGDYSFVQSLIIPEIEINELTGEYDKNFVHQQVDFYLPAARLVIEIDGQHHKINNLTRVSDQTRDTFLHGKGISTVRITTRELQQNTFGVKVKQILDHLGRYEKMLDFFKKACRKHESHEISEMERTTKLLPTAIIRFEILLIELLANGYLNLKDTWRFNILAREHTGNFASLAVEDFHGWIKQIWRLKNKIELKMPEFEVSVVTEDTEFIPSTKAINVDFSLFEKYTDINIHNPDIIYMRTDYFDVIKDRNYFRVSCAAPINYAVTEDDKETLTFFLENIFDKPSFRDGQFPILQNELNRRDTIGLLPTGGGKSLCYQLPCLLQPSINFVVCPIKSLMFDQEDNLKGTLITNVAHITSDRDAEDRRSIELDFEKGRYLFVWISPEKLQITSFREKILAINSAFSISYAVIDEVHCLSEWGHDFRTSYLNLAKTIDKLSPKDSNGEGAIKFIGLTATASVNVLKDIRVEFARQKQKLADENIKSLLDYSRKELFFKVVEDGGNKSALLEKLIRELADREGLTETDEKAAIIFTPNVNGPYGCYSVSNHLNTIWPHKSNWYAGEAPKIDERDNSGYKTGRKLPVMSPDVFKRYKQDVQRNFKDNKFPFMVATKAFGMGIDKKNIFYTFHYGLPGSVEALYQEAGRAGRWDQNYKWNEDLTGECIVLYTRETHDDERVRRLFERDTTFREMKKISEEAGFGGRDIFKQIFLFVQGQNDIEADFELTLRVLKRYYQPNIKKQVLWEEARRVLNVGNDVLQKAIYRLSLLGIVKDWTTNFIDHFEVEFGIHDDRSIMAHVGGYVNKYEPDREIEKEIMLVDQPSVTEKALWYLLEWIFQNIAYNRKQSLKTLVDWCNDFQDSHSFKRRIDNYFKFTEVTFILQHITENPLDYQQWFAALTIIERDNFNAIKSRVFLPGITNLADRKMRFENLRDGISRFLEGYANNTGLNFLSGLVRLFIDEYMDSDGIDRFENALEGVKTKFNKGQQEDIINRLLELGLTLDEANKVNLCKSICELYPEKLEYVAGYYDLDYLLQDRYEKMLAEFKNLNLILHEQLSQI